MADRSRGALALSRVGLSQDAIARALGCSRALAGHYLSGFRLPTKERRQKMFELWQIRAEWWDESADARPGPKPQSPTPAAAVEDADVIGGAFGMARELERMAQQQMRALREDPDSNPLERARVMASIATTLNTLAKITGQYDLGKKIFQLPSWKRIEVELAEALRPWPDVARAVAERLRRLDESATA